MQMVILAGGSTGRMKPLSEMEPNPLVTVEGRPFLAYQLDLLRANGIKRVVLCVGRLGHEVKAYFRDGASFGVNIQYSDDGPRLLGTAGALRKARRVLDETFFVMYGDSYVVVQYPRVWAYFRRFDRLGLLVLNQAKRDNAYATCLVRDGLVTQYRPGAPGMNFCDTGLSIFRREALSLVPPRRRLELPILFDRLARQGQLLALRTESGRHCIASQAGLTAFRRYIAAMSA